MAPRGKKIDGALIGRLRTQQLGITQAEMASRLGIHWVTQSNIENGKAFVSLELIERITELTGATRDQLLAVSANGAAEDGEDDDEGRASVMRRHAQNQPEIIDVLIDALTAFKKEVWDGVTERRT